MNVSGVLRKNNARVTVAYRAPRGQALPELRSRKVSIVELIVGIVLAIPGSSGATSNKS